MRTPTKLRLIGAVILLFNLWLIGEYRLSAVPTLLLTFGFAVLYEWLVVRPSIRSVAPHSPSESSRAHEVPDVLAVPAVAESRSTASAETVTNRASPAEVPFENEKARQAARKRARIELGEREGRNE